MAITTFSSRQFNQDSSRAKKAAQAGPVFITDRGRTAHVLLTFAAYQKITQQRASIADLLAMPGHAADVADFEPPVLRDLPQAADLQ